MVEIELSVLFISSMLQSSIANLETMKQEVTAWKKEMNQQKATVNWRFTNQDAQVKLERLYPQIDLS